ncbi:hypothetical protein JW935_08805, partial [candidate division KSB1 bacterium]|nr:hypothetical protein [candidate division KSB1 bacterium]
ILYDNMKTAFVYSHVEEKWQPNKHLLSLARHYGFTPRRCRVRRPQTKGKVERFIHFYENNFWIEWKRRANGLEELNEAVLGWIDEISTNAIGGIGESRKERYEREKSHLIPLPRAAFDCRKSSKIRVSGESLARVEGNWYSVSPEYIGKELTVKIDPMAAAAELSLEDKIIHSFPLDRERKNQRYYQPHHRKALYALWREQQRPRKRTVRKRPEDVPIRSPQLYEQLFASREAAS